MGAVNTALAVSPDGSRLLTGLVFGAQLWNRKGSLVTPLTGHSAEVQSAQFCAGGKYVVTAGLDATVRLWDGQSGRLLATQQNPVNSAEVIPSPDCRYIASRGKDGVVRLWDIKATRYATDDAGVHQAYARASVLLDNLTKGEAAPGGR
jgi:WD40 repeat protein